MKALANDDSGLVDSRSVRKASTTILEKYHFGVDLSPKGWQILCRGRRPRFASNRSEKADTLVEFRGPCIDVSALRAFPLSWISTGGYHHRQRVYQPFRLKNKSHLKTIFQTAICRTAQALPAVLVSHVRRIKNKGEAEPRGQCVPRQSLGTSDCSTGDQREVSKILTSGSSKNVA